MADEIKSDLHGITVVGGTQADHDFLRRRGEFAENYCKERGWDFDDPTMEQIMEIRSQPGWKNA